MLNNKGFSHIVLLPIVIIFVLLGSIPYFILSSTNQQATSEEAFVLEETVLEESGQENIVQDKPLQQQETSQPAVSTATPSAPTPPVQTPAGTKAYGKIKLMDFNCDDRELAKGTKLVTESGLAFQLVASENPKCINLHSIGYSNPKSWQDLKNIKKNYSFPEASIVTVKAIETGKKYEIGENVFMKLESEDISSYAGFSVVTFVGGEEGGL